MKWPGEPFDSQWDVNLSRQRRGNIVQVDAFVENKGAGLYSIQIEERAVRPQKYTKEYNFRTRSQLVNPLKDDGFEKYTYTKLAEFFTEGKILESTNFDPLEGEIIDILYDTSTTIEATPLTTINQPLPVSTRAVGEGLVPVVNILGEV